MDHRLFVSLRDAASQRPVQDAAVWLDVAELGYRGTAMPMQISNGGEAGFYEARVRMQRGALHRILVYATPRPGARTLEAQFEYHPY